MLAIGDAKCRRFCEALTRSYSVRSATARPTCRVDISCLSVLRLTTYPSGMNSARHYVPSSRLTSTIAVAGILVLASACATPARISHVAVPQVDLSGYASYSLVKSRVGAPETHIVMSNVIHRMLGVRGYESVGSDLAELIVTYKVVTEDSAQAVSFKDSAHPQLPRMAGDSGIFGDLIPNDVAPTAAVDKLVMVQLQDAKTKEIVWAGWARSKVAPDRIVTSTSDAIVRIMTRVPYRI